MSGQPYRSKLNPHLGFMREARLREETWEEIARQINERGTPTDRSQVCKFFLRRLGGKRPAGFAPDPAASARSASGTPSTAPPTGGGNFSDDGDMEPSGRNKLIIKVSP